MPSLKKVTVDDLYETIDTCVKNSGQNIRSYNEMVDIILNMIKDGYYFPFDRDILRDAMDSLTYMYFPEEEMNKDRLIQQLDDDVDEADDDEDDDDEMSGQDLMRMMQMMGMPPMKTNEESSADASKEEVTVTKEDESKSAEPVTDECDKECCP